MVCGSKRSVSLLFDCSQAGKKMLLDRINDCIQIKEMGNGIKTTAPLTCAKKMETKKKQKLNAVTLVQPKYERKRKPNVCYGV